MTAIHRDLLTVLDNASLAGALDVKLANGFAPYQGEAFNILTYGSRTGGFNNVVSMDTGYTYNVSYNDTTGVVTLFVVDPKTISSVPEGSTLTTAGLILVTGGLLLRRRSRLRPPP